MAGASLFEEIVAGSGLSGVFAPGALRRAITRAGFDPEKLTREELHRSLPSIRLALGVFLASGEVELAMERITKLGPVATAKR